MTKRFLLACAASIAMLTCPSLSTSAFAVNQAQEQQSTEVQMLPDGQEAIPVEGINSTEVNTVRESSTARKMTQAEKVENAKQNDEYGGGITIIAMCIVILALAVLSILFLIFGKISSTMLNRKKRKAMGVSKNEMKGDRLSSESGEVIAAIALALNQHFNNDGHDLERTFLTLRRMKRAYSPWNSKIYNIRQIPEVRK